MTERLYIKGLHPVSDGDKGDRRVTGVCEHRAVFGVNYSC